jgi:hypothetical protein
MSFFQFLSAISGKEITVAIGETGISTKNNIIRFLIKKQDGFYSIKCPYKIPILKV